MAGAHEGTSSPLESGPLDDVTPCCYFLKCTNTLNGLPVEFSDLLKLHNKTSVSIIQGCKIWKLEVKEASFQEGWSEFISDNLIKRHNRILLRHNGNLAFDLILFTNLKVHACFPWTKPLSDVLKHHLSNTNDRKPKYILHQHACSAIRPDIVQDLTNSLPFYHIYSERDKNHLKVPKAVDSFLNGSKAPTVTLRSGYRAFHVQMDANQFTDYWQTFVNAHHLEAGEALVFIPEAINSFTVQIYKTNGTEKLFPWYHKYYVLSYL